VIRAIRRHLLDRFVLRPSRHALDHAPKERVLIRTEGEIDECFLERPSRLGLPSEHSDSPDLLVIKFPGTSGRAERSSSWPAGCLGAVDTLVCTWNAPGYGGSSGRATLARIPDRASRMAKTWLNRYAVGGRPVWLVGNSLGCATAVYLASRNDIRVDGLILRNPPPLIETFKHVASRYPFGHLTDAIAESLPAEMNLASTAPRVRVPTVMLQSEHDQLVPPSLQRGVFEALGGAKRLVVLKGIGHDAAPTEEHAGDIAAAVRWLWRQRVASSAMS